MATAAGPLQLAAQARRLYVEGLVRNLAALVQAALEGSRSLIDKPCEHAVFMRRRDLLQELQKSAQGWHRGMVNALRQALAQGGQATRPAGLPGAGGASALDRALWREGHRPLGISKFGTGTAALHPELPSNKWARVLRDPFRNDSPTHLPE